MPSSGPSPEMPACRMPNNDYTVQIKGVCFGQHAQVINGVGDILKGTGPSTAWVISLAIFYIPRCYTEARQSRGKSRCVLEVSNEVPMSGLPAPSMNDNGNWMPS